VTKKSFLKHLRKVNRHGPKSSTRGRKINIQEPASRCSEYHRMRAAEFVGERRRIRRGGKEFDDSLIHHREKGGRYKGEASRGKSRPRGKMKRRRSLIIEKDPEGEKWSKKRVSKTARVRST